MVQTAETRRKSDISARRSKNALRLSLSGGEEGKCNCAVPFRKIDCDSLEEVLSHCGVSSLASTEKVSQLGVHALEKDSLLLPRFPNGMHISSPRMFYGHNETQINKQKLLFDYPSTGIGSAVKMNFRAREASAMPKHAVHNSSSAADKTYTVESVSTDCLKDSKKGIAGSVVTPTYTVVFLGELSVGKSALCKKFFRSGMTQGKQSTDDLFQQLDLTDDDDYYSYDILDQSKHSDSHHVYERPVTVDGRCVRLRILDINSEKHRNECGSECGDFEPFLGVGEAYALIYSIADRGTFQTVMEILSRMNSKHEEMLRTMPVILVGNKCDLVRNRQVTKANGIKIATQHNIKFIETSASLNENVTELFEGMIQQIQLRRSRVKNEGEAATSSSSLLTAKGDLTKDKDSKAIKATRKGSGSRKKRHPKRVFTRRLTEFLTGSTQDPKNQRAKSCQDLSVL